MCSSPSADSFLQIYMMKYLLVFVNDPQMQSKYGSTKKDSVSPVLYP